MVITDVNQVVYLGDGVTTAFPFTFRIIDATDVKLLLIDADGTETDITSDYFVDTVNSTVHYPGYAPGAEPSEADQPAPVQEGQRLVVYRELPVTQEKDLGDKWPFFVIELALDKLTMLIQGISGIWNRCLRVTVGQSATHPDFNYNIPIEAGKTFRVKDDGTGFELTEDPAVAHAAAVAAQEAAERAQGAAEDARDDAEAAADNAEDALDLIKEKATWFDNVATMKAAAGLQVGMLAGTKGYYSINDGGSSIYSIRAKTQEDVDDGGSIIILDNGNVAELIAETINYKQFGAVADGETNDYNAIKSCHLYANKTGKTVVNHGGTYYVTGATIPVETDVYNYGDTTYIVGTDNIKTNALFSWSHDSVTTAEGALVSSILSDAITVQDAYKNKAFLIKTNISLGTNQDVGGTDTIMEPMLANGNSTELFMDSYSTVSGWTVDVDYITDASEKGLTWDGGKLLNKDTSTYGTCFLSAQRNNCTIRNLYINCNSTNAEHATIEAKSSNNLLIENIVVDSVATSGTWGYWLMSAVATNMIVRNVKQVNGSINNTWGQRTMKNVTVSNCKLQAYDCHWNTFGVHEVVNCQLATHAHTGYGKGKFIVKGCTVGTHIGGRADFIPIYAGDFVIEDTQYGAMSVWMRTAPSNDSTRDMTYFATLPVPRVFITRSQGTERAFRSNLYDWMQNLLADRITVTFTECKTQFMTNPYGDDFKYYRFVFVRPVFSSFSDFATYYKSVTHPTYIFIDTNGVIYSNSVTPATGVSFSGSLPNNSITIKAGTCFLSFSIIATANLASWASLATIDEKFAPGATVYGTMVISGVETIPIAITNKGVIQVTKAINITGNRITVCAYW